jgi:pseudouridine-5'-phosphate glycosidase
MTAVRSHLRVAPEVDQALAAGRPIVALESAVLSHGLPQNEARWLARRLDEIVRTGGATPALVAVRAGRIEVGLEPRAIDFLFGRSVGKIAERDLAVAVATRASGGTTVAGTLAVMARAGIHVMATGGIGGVHLDVETSGDVSADLAALARHCAVVVCAGPKAICDLPRTVEMLDTLGVTVVGYRTDTMPGFFTGSTGIAVPHRVETPADAAAIAQSMVALDDRSALLLVQPLPEDAALDARVVDDAMAVAMTRARSEAVTGARLTPYLLAALADVTGGKTLKANLALLEANAGLAAAVAVAWAAHPRA